MRRSIPLAAIAAALLAAWISYAFAQDAKRGGGDATRAWEYRIVVLTDVVNVQQAFGQEPGKTAAAIESKFNELGRDGWDYCGEWPGVAVFKRPKP
ncbi:hypothetical protein [Aquisphaera insulae]|uniref:hypothetical protein n=1 Tax=Aquisphaera insulae TaxID=2712864 RepID=UPI0013EE2C6B|nr:hypothetical protein [Aquisphaera insulae]